MQRSNKKPKRRALQSVPRFDDSSSYAGQARVRLTLPGVPQLLSTTVTTGVIANFYGVNIGAVTGFAARFGSTFDEYRIVSCRMMIRPISASTGVSVHWFDEKSGSAPTSNESQERIGARIPNTNASDKAVLDMSWKARDLLDLNYTAIGTTVTPVTFKTYTDTANWGAPSVVTPMWLLESMITFEFKGLKST